MVLVTGLEWCVAGGPTSEKQHADAALTAWALPALVTLAQLIQRRRAVASHIIGTLWRQGKGEAP